MDSDLEMHENSEVNKDTPSLPANEKKDCLMSRNDKNGKAKKKPSKSTVLQQEYDQKLKGLQDNFDNKFEILFNMMQSLANVRGANNDNVVQNRDTQGMPISETNADSRGQNRDTKGLLRSDTLRPIIPLVSNLDEDLGSPRVSRNTDFDARSEISIHVNPKERDILGEFALIMSQTMRAKLELNSQQVMSVARKGERFMKHVQLKSVSNEVNKDSELSSDTRHNVLSELFSEDIASNNDKGSVGLIMDQAQVTILENSWRCQHPEILYAYREEYRICFPVHDSAMEFLQVPSLYDLLEPMIRKNHGPKAVKSWDTGHRQLHTQPLKQFLACEDVFGNGLKSCLEKSKEQKDQLNDLLPELGQGRKRRADFDGDWQNKNPKFNVEHYAVNTSKTRGSNNNRFNVPKTSNSGRQPQRDNQGYKGPAKESNRNKTGQSSWGSFGSPERTTVDSKVGSSLMTCTEIPVGGRLKYFLQNWKMITTDQLVLSIIEEGYKLEFLQRPAWTGIKKTIISHKNTDIFLAEINSLLEKDAIEKMNFPEYLLGFYSTLFLVPKKNGKMRPVTNLKPLNAHLKKVHFKMDTMSKVINLVKPKDWAISIDLSDAYFHVPIFQKHRPYMRFCIANQCY
ncbi:unnamed protein product [Mytilus coruscus]|uniref:Reverse transcriptase domain-containing protein n=1 Tax=Mytilus coruscus TaxID=42192 RepID=A0A6J8D6S3_MYTCO|nr:unnamed protein product [Mytilus coruscus]